VALQLFDSDTIILATYYYYYYYYYYYLPRMWIKIVKRQSCPSHKTRRAVLISVSLALSETPVYTAKQRILGECIKLCARFHPLKNFHQNDFLSNVSRKIQILRKQQSPTMDGPEALFSTPITLSVQLT